MPGLQSEFMNQGRVAPAGSDKMRRSFIILLHTNNSALEVKDDLPLSRAKPLKSIFPSSHLLIFQSITPSIFVFQTKIKDPTTQQ